jgi:hypothetical protein
MKRRFRHASLPSVCICVHLWLTLFIGIGAARVTVKVIGRKAGDVLLVKGEPSHGHQDDNAERPGDEPDGDFD